MTATLGLGRLPSSREDEHVRDHPRFILAEQGLKTRNTQQLQPLQTINDRLARGLHIKTNDQDSGRVHAGPGIAFSYGVVTLRTWCNLPQQSAEFAPYRDDGTTPCYPLPQSFAEASSLSAKSFMATSRV